MVLLIEPNYCLTCNRLLILNIVLFIAIVKLVNAFNNEDDPSCNCGPSPTDVKISAFFH